MARRAAFATLASASIARPRRGARARGTTGTRATTARDADGRDLRAPRAAYVHLPFCRSRCYYCDFAISVVGRAGETRPDVDAAMRRYGAATRAEVAATARAMRANGALDASAPLETVFFGGGTPSLMPADEIKAILGSLREAFGLAADAEVSAEMDPGTFDEEKLRAFLAAGVNRVSLGVQSFDDGVLQRAGRSHDARAAEEAIDTLRRCGAPRWSADLISGLPGVDAKTWRTSLERVIEAGADHVSVYDLQVERGTAFYRWYGENAGKDKKEGLPSEDASAAMFRDASATLGAAGYEHYEVSSYAKPGARCKHNQIYWENAGWYGFGLSATSHVNGERVARPRKMNEYYAYVEALERGENVGTVSSGGDGSDALFEHIMLRLRTSDGLDLGNVSRRFGDHVVEEIREAMGPFVPEFAEYTVAADSSPAALRLTDPEGFLVSTAVLSTLISKMPSLEDDE